MRCFCWDDEVPGIYGLGGLIEAVALLHVGLGFEGLMAVGLKAWAQPW